MTIGAMPTSLHSPASHLPAPAARTHLHTRSVTYTGYARDDGLWDIEGEMTDVRTYALDRGEGGAHPAGEPVHGMAIRATVDDTLTIRAITSAMAHTPFGECQQGNDPLQQMLGVTMGPGWRQAIERALGGTRGCTHLRELLFNMATAAYQTVPIYMGHRRAQARRQTGEPRPAATEPAYHMGKCVAWAFDGAVISRHYPQFAGWQPKPVPAKGASNG